EVLVLSRFQELKYEEIAEMLDCPVGTIKARVHWALKDLRENFLELTQ
ncbi:RNA polymerase subunit sigma, partial [candidate division KSB1 bacterium]|nr:RNA polymerase subunit sigma [candidate division KSB1 bacterium]